MFSIIVWHALQYAYKSVCAKPFIVKGRRLCIAGLFKCTYHALKHINFIFGIFNYVYIYIIIICICMYMYVCMYMYINMYIYTYNY